MMSPKISPTDPLDFRGVIVFYHIATINHFNEVVAEQVSAMRIAGLMENKVMAGVVGPMAVRYPLPQGIQCIYRGSRINEYEFPTVRAMWTFCKNNPRAKVLYLHTKGVSRPKNEALAVNWRKFMMHYMIERWRECVPLLKRYDIVGLNWRPLKKNKLWHFSGNFYWARAHYIASLAPPVNKTNDRRDVEFWIGSGKGKAAEVYKINLLEPNVNAWKDRKLKIQPYDIESGRAIL